jgi:hypothetical protein
VGSDLRLGTNRDGKQRLHCCARTAQIDRAGQDLAMVYTDS